MGKKCFTRENGTWYYLPTKEKKRVHWIDAIGEIWRVQKHVDRSGRGKINGSLHDWTELVKNCMCRRAGASFGTFMSRLTCTTHLCITSRGNRLTIRQKNCKYMIYEQNGQHNTHLEKLATARINSTCMDRYWFDFLVGASSAGSSTVSLPGTGQWSRFSPADRLLIDLLLILSYLFWFPNMLSKVTAVLLAAYCRLLRLFWGLELNVV